MDAIPKLIYKNYNNKEIDKSSAIEQLISLIENSDNIYTRLKSIKILGVIDAKTKKIFKILENLLISDESAQIRQLAAKTIKNLFPEKALTPMIWAYKHETSVNCLITIISTLGEINNPKSKAFLIDKINKIDNPHFIRDLNNIFKIRTIQSLSCAELAEIVNNYIIINYFEKKFIRINFTTKNALVSELDLSCVSSNIFGWNVLKYLPDFISTLQLLKKLDLKINRILKIPSSIGDLPSLEYLDLSNNIIKNLPDSIGNLKSLKFLYLRYNNLKTIPNSIGLLRSLKILDLRHNKLITIPNSINHLSSLEILDLHGNQLNELPDSFKILTSLKQIELGVNNLKNFPEWIKKLPKLEKLGFGGNKFVNKLPEWLGSLQSLKVLHLYDMNLKELPESIGMLSSLEELTIRNNRLTTLPKSFRNLTSLKKLNLSWNTFINLPEWIGALSSLEELNLWGNWIEELPESMGYLSSLKILNLTYNKLKDIPESLKKIENSRLTIFK